MPLETLFTLMLLIGVAALTVWLFSRALRRAVKFICNGICGVILLILFHWLGLPLPLNIFTLIVALAGGGLGVILMMLYYLLF